MNEVYQKFFQASPVAQVIINKDSCIQYVNQRAAQLFQYEVKELLGKNISLLIPDGHKNHHPELVKSFFQSPQPRKMGQGRNLFGLKKNGKSFPVEVGLSPVETTDGLLVLSSVIDLTQQFLAEEKFKSAVESAPNGMLMIDSRGIIILVNKKIEELFGYERSELLGQPMDILVPDEFKAHHPRFVQSFIENPSPRSMGIGRDLFAKNKTGRLFPVEIGLQPLQEEDDKVFVLASIVDITLRRQSELEIQEKSEELKEFAYRTSHDLKSPLTTMSAMLGCIKEDLQNGDVDEAIKNVDKIHKVSKNLQTLVQSILFLTKADLSEDQLKAFDFTDYLHNFKLAYQAQIEKTGVKIESNFDHSKDFVTQKIKLSQILDNLLSNAIKFSVNVDRESVIKISTHNDTHHFYIQVKDNGPGIPLERQKEVFSMFKRFHHGIEGNGIGLYMVRKFTNKLNGQISFDSTENGTRFYLKFPL